MALRTKRWKTTVISSTTAVLNTQHSIPFKMVGMVIDSNAIPEVGK
jgi:hypothetical protein